MGFKLLASSKWDIVPVLCGLAHAGFVAFWFLSFPHFSWWENGLMGLIYSWSIAWNVNSVSHNFIHNPYFVSPLLNRLFSLLESVTMGFSQTFYDRVHLHHHMGNNDRQDESGDTVDWVSFYREGRNGQAESVWTYSFLSYFRDDFELAHRQLKKQNPEDARWGVFELVCVVLVSLTLLVLNSKFMLCILPFYYLGHSFSALNGFYEHYGADPDVPIAWGVSNYGKLYNWTWLNNGYHAEHHYRPKHHWTRMHDLHLQIRDDQRKAGVKVIDHAHVLGFLQHFTSPRKQSMSQTSV